jgi:hypothetical protein
MVLAATLAVAACGPGAQGGYSYGTPATNQLLIQTGLGMMGAYGSYTPARPVSTNCHWMAGQWMCQTW